MYSTELTEIAQWIRHRVYWFFDTSQGDVVPELVPMLTPHNFEL